MNKPKPIPPEERTCKICGKGVEDEFHFVCICPLYRAIREQLYAKCPFENLSERELFVSLFKSTDPTIVFALGEYARNAFQARKRFLNPT
jgi:hypothetical protein